MVLPASEAVPEAWSPEGSLFLSLLVQISHFLQDPLPTCSGRHLTQVSPDLVRSREALTHCMANTLQYPGRPGLPPQPFCHVTGTWSRERSVTSVPDFPADGSSALPTQRELLSDHSSQLSSAATSLYAEFE